MTQQNLPHRVCNVRREGHDSRRDWRVALWMCGLIFGSLASGFVPAAAHLFHENRFSGIIFPS